MDHPLIIRDALFLQQLCSSYPHGKSAGVRVEQDKICEGAIRLWSVKFRMKMGTIWNTSLQACVWLEPSSAEQFRAAVSWSSGTVLWHDCVMQRICFSSSDAPLRPLAMLSWELWTSLLLLASYEVPQKHSQFDTLLCCCQLFWLLLDSREVVAVGVRWVLY